MNLGRNREASGRLLGFGVTSPTVEGRGGDHQYSLSCSDQGMTAEQIKKSGRPIQTWNGKNGPTAHERRIAKNYLTEDELKKLVKRGALIMAHVNVRFEDGPKPTMDQFLDTIREVLGSLPPVPAVTP
ncbi:hypothetical protein ACH347_42270 [Saccharopolyspora sp. 5N102]|uniref:hypothetical protein n=1 Tax=Saccharopolyspora sp. 5N102 TaxID=3375155 RepID=UPI0037A482C4